ncbi:MAG: RNA polymerase sigma factor [Bacteroidales bacterium]|nr:RNA polymerase sigma factor [Bacteroidales bacterium]
MSLTVKQTNKLAEVYSDIHKEIIEKSKIGNKKAQYQLYQLYSKAMFNICYRMMNNREEAEDILQEAFSETFHRLNSFRFESSFGAWLKRIVVNKCINELKRKKAELVLYENINHFDYVEEETKGYEDKLTIKNVQNAIEQLPEGYRVVFSLYLLEGYDHSEISEILGVSESTSKTQYMRAKNKIKQILKTQMS